MHLKPLLSRECAVPNAERSKLRVLKIAERLEDADALRRNLKGGLAEERRRQRGPGGRSRKGSTAALVAAAAAPDAGVEQVTIGSRVRRCRVHRARVV